MSSKSAEYGTNSPADYIPTVDSPRVDLEGMANSDEERRGLLSDGAKDYDELDHASSRLRLSRNTVMGLAVGFILLFIGAVVARPLLSGGRPKPDFDCHKLRSNGTHQFKKTSLIVSIDGLRADYLDRGLTPHLLAISKKGIRAKSMKPIFPTLTFPNHWTLMTGLYAESHGIVANNFWDPYSGLEFHYNRVESVWNSSWWSGEPMWETAERAGLITANLMWPGPPSTTSGAKSMYFIPWADKIPLQVKLDQILSWIDLPLEKRPQLIMAYEPSLDQAGHLAGPASKLVNKVLGEVDVFARDLNAALEARNLTDIIDIVFVSDHGMTDTSHPEFIFVDDILGDAYHTITHADGWPAMGLRFSTTANETYSLGVLRDAAAASGGKFDVFTKDTMPMQYHFVTNERIAPVYVVPRVGYVLTDRAENGEGMNKGSHGYDNDETSMHAMFVAHGPFSSVVKAVHQSRETHLFRRLLTEPSQGWQSTADGTYVMDVFENVQIYNLMMKLLGIEDRAAHTNGTEGFWDKYF